MDDLPACGIVRSAGPTPFPLPGAVPIAYVAGVAALTRGDLAQALAEWQRCGELHRRQGGDPVGGLLVALAVEALALALVGEVDRAAAVAEECRAGCERHGEQWVRSY